VARVAEGHAKHPGLTPLPAGRVERRRAAEEIDLGRSTGVRLARCVSTTARGLCPALRWCSRTRAHSLRSSRSIKHSRVFCGGHVEAFQTYGGIARTLVYNNLKSAVLERQGFAIRFHPRLLELAGRYHFAPRPCTPGRGNEKGKIERQLHYLRHVFVAARTFRDVDDLNAQFRRWRDEVAHQRPHPEQRDQTVAQVLAQEQPRLLPLPAHPFETT
jgi:transposase